VRACREWAEEHWETVGMALSIGCAVTIAGALMLLFNVVSTHLEAQPPSVPTETSALAVEQ
jgi:hypothetical protein